MTVQELSIAFIHRLPVVLAMPNKPRLQYSEILYIEYSRQKGGNKRVNAGMIDDKAPSSVTVARLKYIEPCLNNYPDDDGDTYSFNTAAEDYKNTRPIVINSEIKETFDKLLPVEVKVEARKLNPEVQQRLMGCVANGKTLTLYFPYIQRLRIYLDHNRAPILYADFNIGVEVPIKDIKIITLGEYFKRKGEKYEKLYKDK